MAEKIKTKVLFGLKALTSEVMKDFQFAAETLNSLEQSPVNRAERRASSTSQHALFGTEQDDSAEEHAYSASNVEGVGDLYNHPEKLEE